MKRIRNSDLEDCHEGQRFFFIFIFDLNQCMFLPTAELDTIHENYQ